MYHPVCCVQNDIYNFPFVQVCFWEGRGCSYPESECVESAVDNGFSAMYNEEEVASPLVSEVGSFQLSFWR